jgi:hypothetical protein
LLPSEGTIKVVDTRPTSSTGTIRSKASTHYTAAVAQTIWTDGPGCCPSGRLHHHLLHICFCFYLFYKARCTDPPPPPLSLSLTRSLTHSLTHSLSPPPHLHSWNRCVPRRRVDANPTVHRNRSRDRRKDQDGKRKAIDRTHRHCGSERSGHHRVLRRSVGDRWVPLHCKQDAAWGWWWGCIGGFG